MKPPNLNLKASLGCVWEAQHYIHRIEELVGCDVTWVGVGVGREDMATKGFQV